MNQNLKMRIATALPGLALILWILISGGIAGATFFAWVISMGMLYEFCKISFTLPDAKTKTIMVLLFNTFIYAANFALGSGLSHAFLGLVPLISFSIIFLLKTPSLLVLTAGQDSSETLSKHIQELMAICFGFTYCGWLPLLMIKIREHQNGAQWLILTLFAVWATDTGAYFAGKYFGKRKLFPSVSPKKTWEGALGGTLLSLVVGLIFVKIWLPATDMFEIVIVLTVVSLISQVGDLCESLLKRAAKVKDSSGLLPGHGGFLDRFDSLMFALPVMNAYLWIFSGF